MKLIFATWLLEKQQGFALQKLGTRNRLLSYFHTIEKESELKQYIQKGEQNEDPKIKVCRNS